VDLVSHFSDTTFLAKITPMAVHGHEKVHGGDEGLRHHLCLHHGEHLDEGTPAAEMEELHEDEHGSSPAHRGEYGCPEHGAEDEPHEWDELSQGIGPIHRGIGVDLPDELHKLVHDRRRRPADRAQALLSHLREYPHGGIGVHWSTSQSVAEDFAERAGRPYATERKPGTAVVFHAAEPAREDIDHHIYSDPTVYGYHDHGEREVPLTHGDNASLTGISWAPMHDDRDHPRDGVYERHDFGGHEPREAVVQDDMVDLYHHTHPESAEEIYRDREFIPGTDEDRVYFTNMPSGGSGESDYGSGVVHLRMPRHLVNDWGADPHGEHYYDVSPDDIRPEHFVEPGDGRHGSREASSEAGGRPDDAIHLPDGSALVEGRRCPGCNRHVTKYKGVWWNDDDSPHDCDDFAREASAAPGGATRLWHVSDRADRASIQASGLEPRQPEAEGQGPGVYAWRVPSHEDAWRLFDAQYAFPGHDYDIWHVDAAGLPVHHDPTWQGESAVIPAHVHPDRLRLVHSPSGSVTASLDQGSELLGHSEAAAGPPATMHATAGARLQPWHQWAADTPHKAVIWHAQERTRDGHPELAGAIDDSDPYEVIPRDSDAGTALLRRILGPAHPGAWAMRHPQPGGGRTSQVAVRDGVPGVVIHPERWDKGTLAHEAAHLAHIAAEGSSPEQANSWPEDVKHGPEFARHYATALDAVSPGAGADFLRHHGDATVLVSNFRKRVHGLGPVPAPEGGLIGHFEAASFDGPDLHAAPEEVPMDDLHGVASMNHPGLTIGDVWEYHHPEDEPAKRHGDEAAAETARQQAGLRDYVESGGGIPGELITCAHGSVLEDGEHRYMAARDAGLESVPVRRARGCLMPELHQFRREASSRPGRGEQACPCCRGQGSHGGDPCRACDGEGSVGRGEAVEHCPGEPRPRRRHWREAAAEAKAPWADEPPGDIDEGPEIYGDLPIEHPDDTPYHDERTMRRSRGEITRLSPDTPFRTIQGWLTKENLDYLDANRSKIHDESDPIQVIHDHATGVRYLINGNHKVTVARARGLTEPIPAQVRHVNEQARQAAMPSPNYDPSAELPVGRGIWYRLHDMTTPFDEAHARSRLVDSTRYVPGKDKGAAQVRTGLRGYSAFAHPSHLRDYLDEYGWTGNFGDESRVLAFHGRQVGRGEDNEPLVIPAANHKCCGRVIHAEWPYEDFEQKAGEAAPPHPAAVPSWRTLYAPDPTPRSKSVRRHYQDETDRLNREKRRQRREAGAVTHPDAAGDVTVEHSERPSGGATYPHMHVITATHPDGTQAELRYMLSKRDARGIVDHSFIPGGYARSLGVPLVQEARRLHPGTFVKGLPGIDEDWGQHLPGVTSLHRQLTVKLDPADRDYVHDESVPRAQRAAHLMGLMERSGPSMHWASQRGRAAAEKFGDHEFRSPEHTQVALSAGPPSPEHVETDPERISRNGGYAYQAPDWEVPLKEGAQVSVSSVRWRTGDSGWTRHQFKGGHQFTAGRAPQGDGPAPGTEVVAHFEAEAAGEDYRIQHQGPAADDGEAMHEIGSGGAYPADIHEHPDWYISSDGPGAWDSWDKVRKSRGWPSRRVTMYRALPSPHRSVNPGDWVSSSAEYARQHGVQSDSADDWPVVKFEARADQLRTDGNSINEWSYHGPPISRARVHYRGGRNHWGNYENAGKIDAGLADHEPPEMHAAYSAQTAERRRSIREEREAQSPQPGIPSREAAAAPAAEVVAHFEDPAPSVRKKAVSEGDERPYGYYTLRHRTEDMGEARPRHFIDAHTPEGSVVGRMNWFGTTGLVHHIDVAGEEDDVANGQSSIGDGRDHQGRGLATAMWDWSQEMSPRAKHSRDQTGQGKKWARGLKGRERRDPPDGPPAAAGAAPEAPGKTTQASLREAAMAPLENPHTGGHEWYHGSPHLFGSFSGDAPDSHLQYEGDENDGSHWNTLLGHHFAASHQVAEEFSRGEHSPAPEGSYEDATPQENVVHARLGIRNPKVYASEHDMDQEAYEREWKAGNHHDAYHHPDLLEDDDWTVEDRPATYQFAGHGDHMRGRDEADPVYWHVHRTYHPYATGWLNSHPDKYGIAQRFRQHLIEQGHDGIVYGNEFEKHHGTADNHHIAAVPFGEHQIDVTQRHRGPACVAPEEAARQWPGRGQQALFDEHGEPHEGVLDVVAHFEGTPAPRLAAGISHQLKLFHMQPEPGRYHPETGRSTPADPAWRRANDPENYEPDECEHCGGDRNFGEEHADTHHQWLTSQDWYTDWDHEGPGDTIHRGVGLDLPDHVHQVVHDESRPVGERAHALLSHMLGSANPGGNGLGNFWSGHSGVSKVYAESAARRYGQHNVQTPVIIHAHTPAMEHIETDPDQLQHWGVYSYHLAGNREVPVSHGAPLRIRGISWAPPGHARDSGTRDEPPRLEDDPAWTHHEVGGEGIRATASGTLSSDHAAEQRAALEVVAHFEVEAGASGELAEKQEWATANRDHHHQDAAGRGHEMRWEHGAGWGTRGNDQHWEGTCANCGAHMVVGSSYTSTHKRRDAREGQCPGPGTAWQSDMQQELSAERVNKAVSQFGQDVKDNIDRQWLRDQGLGEERTAALEEATAGTTVTASWDSSGSEKTGLYLRFGHWPENERSFSPAGGYHEEGVSAYDLDRHGNPAIDHGLDRGHVHEEGCWDDCDLGDDDPDNDPREEMQGRVSRAEKNRRWGDDKPHETGHLVRGEMTGVGYDGEPLLKKVRRVGDWIDHRHLFFGGEPHRLARSPEDDDYEPPEEAPRHLAALEATSAMEPAHEDMDEQQMRRHMRYWHGFSDSPEDPDWLIEETHRNEHADAPLEHSHRDLESDPDWEEEVGQNLGDKDFLHQHGIEAALEPVVAHFEVTAATDWDQIYDKLPGEVHRGLYAPESHGLFIVPMSDKDIAHGLIAAHQEEQFPYDRDQHLLFGTHWASDEDVARGFALEHEREHLEEDPDHDHDEHSEARPVVFHAQRPQRHEIEDDPRRLGWQNVADHDHPEHEVPIRHGAPVRITGVSWLKHTGLGPLWHRHDFGEPVKLRAEDRDSPDSPDEWNGEKPAVVAHFELESAGEHPHPRTEEEMLSHLEGDHGLGDLGAESSWDVHHDEHSGGRDGPSHQHEAFYHGTSLGREDEEDPPEQVTPQGAAHLYPGEHTGEHAYATTSPSSAWSYAEKAWHAGRGEQPRVLRVRPAGPFEEDPPYYASGASRSVGEGAVRSVHPWEVTGEEPVPDHLLMSREEDGDEWGHHEGSRDEDPDRYVTCGQGHDHWGALGAAGLLIRHHGGDGQTRYLLQKRSPYVQHGDTWSTPGGAIGHGESPEDAATREAEEELGPLPGDLAHHHTVADDHGGWAYHTVVMDSPRQFTPGGGEEEHDWESSGHRWVTPREMRELPLHPGFRASWDQVRKSGALDDEAAARRAREERGDRWHEFGNRYSDDVHRGIIADLPDDLHDYVHDEGVPREERARVLQAHFAGDGLGLHWTTNPAWAARAIQNAASGDESGNGAWRYHNEPSHWYGGDDDDEEEGDGRRTEVMFHAARPGERNRLRNPQQLEDYGVYEGNESEVPLKPGSPVRMTGISWRLHEPQYPNEAFEHVDFPRPVRHVSSRVAAPEPRGELVIASHITDKVAPALPARVPAMSPGAWAPGAPEDAERLVREFPAFLRLLQEGLEALARRMDDQPVTEEIPAIFRRMAAACLTAAEDADRLIPPLDGDSPEGTWQGPRATEPPKG
jgi:8-oxo-dGTP diphosphatase